MVKQLYSPLEDFCFLIPSNDGNLSRFFTSPAAVWPDDEKVFSEWFRADRLNGPWASATPFDAVSPCFRPIYF